MPPPLEDGQLQAHLLHRGRETIRGVHRRLLELRHNPEWLAHPLRQEYKRLFAGKGRDTTLEDFEAETTARGELVKRYSGPYRDVAIEAIGEERMKGEDWAGLASLAPSKKIIALVDPLDGTKLEAREIPTWCIAIVFYERDTGHVLTSLVGQATGSLYLATAHPIGAHMVDAEAPSDSVVAKAWRQVPDYNAPRRDGWLVYSRPQPLSIAAAQVDNACIAFVAPSPRGFLHAARFVGKAHESDPKLLGRVYNMGGNPMLAKVADGTIDAVLGFGDVSERGITAQKPHDYIPGAFIAQQAGAAVIDIESRRSMRFEDQLIQPDKPGKRYIVAHSAALADRCLSAMPHQRPRSRRTT